MYEVSHSVKCISYYGSQTKKMKIAAVDSNFTAFQNIISIYWCGIINTVHLPQQYLHTRSICNTRGLLWNIYWPRTTQKATARQADSAIQGVLTSQGPGSRPGFYNGSDWERQAWHYASLIVMQTLGFRIQVAVNSYRREEKELNEVYFVQWPNSLSLFAFPK